MPFEMSNFFRSVIFMNEMPDVSAVVEIFSNKARMTIIDELMDGRAHTVNELANAAKITPQTATYHLQKMEVLEWVKLEVYGRFHYYTLIKPEVASLFESLSPHSPSKKVASLGKSIRYKKLYYCRTCYDHLAGKVGVDITTKLIENGSLVLEDNNYFSITPYGNKFLTKTFNLDLNMLSKKKKAFCKPCLDWSERKDHIGGAIGNGILQYLCGKSYLIRGSEQRVLSLTSEGNMFLNNQLGLFETAN